MFNTIISNAVLLAALEVDRNRRKRAPEIDQYFVYLSTFVEENYWFNRKLGGVWNILWTKWKMLYQYVNFAFDNINVSKTNNVVIFTIDKELYSFNLFTKIKLICIVENQTLVLKWAKLPFQ